MPTSKQEMWAIERGGLRSRSGYGINFYYENGKMLQYQEVTYSGNGPVFTRSSTNVTYPAHSETVYCDSGLNLSDSYDDICTHYLFDYAGRTVNVYSTDVNGNVLGATNAAYSGNGSTQKDNNRILRTATIGIPAQQLLRNPGMEAANNTWRTASEVSVSTAKPRTGTKSIQSTGSSATTQFAAADSEILNYGTTYTFSCFVDTAAVAGFTGTGIYLQVSDPYGRTYNSQPINYATSPSVDDGWERISVTFTSLYSGVHTVS